MEWLLRARHCSEGHTFPQQCREVDRVTLKIKQWLSLDAAGLPPVKATVKAHPTAPLQCTQCRAHKLYFQKVLLKIP